MAIPPLPVSGSGSDSGPGGTSTGAEQRKAWVTLITNEAYVAGLITLHRTLISVSSYPLVVMATPALPQSALDLIQSFSIDIIPVGRLSVPSSQHGGFDPSFARFDDTWTKLQVFGLDQYERLILIDSDMIFLREMDELFDLPLPGRDWIAAAPACVCNPLKLEHYPKDWIPTNCAYQHQTPLSSLTSPPTPSADSGRTAHLLNSGLVILHPSKETLSQIVHHLQTSPTISRVQFADQDVMAEVFRGRWMPLPWWVNALKTLRAVHRDVWRDGEVRLIHYILDKPWSRRPTSLPPYKAPSAPPTPITASNASSFPLSAEQDTRAAPRRPLPSGLVEAVRSTPAQESLTDYQDVHAWWWIVYEELLDGLKSAGDSRWKEINKHVKW